VHMACYLHYQVTWSMLGSMRVRKTLVQILVFALIATGSSRALPPAGKDPTCAVKGATIQAATVSLEVAGLQKGVVTFWNSESPHFQIPTSHDGSPAHLNLSRFEPNQEINIDLWAHGQFPALHNYIHRPRQSH